MDVIYAGIAIFSYIQVINTQVQINFLRRFLLLLK